MQGRGEQLTIKEIVASGSESLWEILSYIDSYMRLYGYYKHA